MQKMSMSFEVVCGGGSTRMADISDTVIKKALQAFLQELAVHQVEKGIVAGNYSLQNAEWTRHEGTMHLDMATHIREKKSSGRYSPTARQEAEWGFRVSDGVLSSEIKFKADTIRIGTTEAWSRARHEVDVTKSVRDTQLSDFYLKGTRKYSRESLAGRQIAVMDDTDNYPLYGNAAVAPHWIKEIKQ